MRGIVGFRLLSRGAGADFDSVVEDDDDDDGDGCAIVGGRRKGNAPEGEAWLVEGTMSTWTPAMRRKVCRWE